MQENKKISPWNVLRRRFPASEYVLIEEVSDKAGFARSRSLDYMLINLWESRGLAITGIELKSRRYDWLRELKNPKKQENHFKYCDYFVLLTDEVNVAFPAEIPLTWGHWHINEKGVLKIIKEAPKLDPAPVDRSLLCAMLKRAHDKSNYVRITEIEDRINEARQLENDRCKQLISSHERTIEELRKTIKDFETKSGVFINGWRGENMAEAVHFVVNGGLEKQKEQLQELSDKAIKIHRTIKSIIDTKGEIRPEV